MTTVALLAISYQPNTGGIGITFGNIHNTFKVTGEVNVQEILWPLAILCTLIIAPATNLKVITTWPGCESLKNVHAQENEVKPAAIKQSPNLVHEIMDRCKQEIRSMRKKNRNVTFKYTTRKDPSYDLKTAASNARIALDKKLLDNSLNYSVLPVDFIEDSRIKLFTIRKAKMEVNNTRSEQKSANSEATESSSKSSKKTKKAAPISQVVEESHIPIPVTQHQNEIIHKGSKKTKEVSMAEMSRKAEESKITIPFIPPQTEANSCRQKAVSNKGIVFASCSRCAAIVSISCPTPCESTKRMPYMPQRNPILVLTTCRCCIRKMTPNTINAPSVDEVASYLEDVFASAPLASGYIAGSEVYRRVINVNEDTCIASYVDNCIRYIDITTLNSLRDPTYDVRIVDQSTGEFSCTLASDFL